MRKPAKVSECWWNGLFVFLVCKRTVVTQVIKLKLFGGVYQLAGAVECCSSCFKIFLKLAPTSRIAGAKVSVWLSMLQLGKKIKIKTVWIKDCIPYITMEYTSQTVMKGSLVHENDNISYKSLILYCIASDLIEGIIALIQLKKD